MGHVKIDIDRADRNYYNTSFSSEEDINDILFTLDAIKQDAEDGNYEALVTFLDFKKLFLYENDVCNEYYYIITGIRPIEECEYGQEIIEIVASRLEISKEECEQILSNSLKQLIENNKSLWLQWAKKNYIGQHVTKVKNKKYLYNWHCNSVNECEENCICKRGDSSFYQRDYNRKYVVSNMLYKGLETPSDLQEMIDIQKKNIAMIKELEELKKNKEITKKQKEELRKRNNFDISLSKDIVILKQHYNIEIKNTNKKGKTEIVSYLENDDLTKQEFNNFIIDELQLNKINEIAQQVLTNKQLVIFNLYYISTMTQQQIADLIGETKGNISRDLKISIEKIKKNL